MTNVEGKTPLDKKSREWTTGDPCMFVTVPFFPFVALFKDLWVETVR